MGDLGWVEKAAKDLSAFLGAPDMSDRWVTGIQGIQMGSE